jgi:hypothetical protein
MAGLRPGHPFLILRDLWRCAKRQHRLDGRVERPAMTKKGSAVEPPLSASLRYAGHFPHGLRARREKSCARGGAELRPRGQSCAAAADEMLCSAPASVFGARGAARTRSGGSGAKRRRGLFCVLPITRPNRSAMCASDAVCRAQFAETGLFRIAFAMRKKNWRPHVPRVRPPTSFGRSLRLFIAIEFSPIDGEILPPNKTGRRSLLRLRV